MSFLMLWGILTRHMTPQKMIVLVGATASGKSALAVEIAKAIGCLPAAGQGEIISADSRQVYRGLDIGTGKITKKEMRGVPHHLLDIAVPKTVFTAQDFVTLAREKIEDISLRGDVPIVCGGTGFYIDALVGRVPLPNVSADPELRQKLDEQTLAELFSYLGRLDPRRASAIDKYNKRRIIRSIEIALALGKNHKLASRETYDVLWLGISLSPDMLRARIDARLRERLQKGMVAEARRLHAGSLTYKRMDALGLEYRSLSRFLQGRIDKKELELELQNAIWHYARRQMTYWRRNKNIRWYQLENTGQLFRDVERWLT